MERYLQYALKNWFSQQQPPENVRARILLLASARSYPPDNLLVYFCEENYSKSTSRHSLSDNEPARVMDLLWMLHLSTPALRMI
jgi:hypothetical protein